MNKSVIILVCLLTFNGFSQEARKQIIHVYLGTYVNGEVEIDDLLEAPRVNIMNKQGKLVSTTLFDSIGGIPQQQFSNHYDTTGTLISSTYGNGIDKPWSITKYVYNEKGLLTTQESFDLASNKLESKRIYEYDSLNNLIREERIIDGKSYSVDQYLIKYKKEIIKSIEVKKHTTGNLVSHIFETYKDSLKTITVDKLKGWVTTYEYYPDGKEKLSKRVINGKESTQYSYYDYDNKGNLITQAWVEESGYGEITIKTYEF